MICKCCGYSWTSSDEPKHCPACSSIYREKPKVIPNLKKSRVRERLTLVDELHKWKARALEAEAKLRSLF